MSPPRKPPPPVILEIKAIEASNGNRYQALRITSTNRRHAMDWCRMYIGKEHVGDWAVLANAGTVFLTNVQLRDVYAVIGGRELEFV